MRFTAGLLYRAFPLRVVKGQGVVKVPCGLSCDQERLNSAGTLFLWKFSSSRCEV